MSRRREVAKREILPDPKFQSELLAKFMNVLMVGGKFNEAKALEYIQQFYSNIPKPTRVLQPTYTVEPVQDGERYVELKRVGDIQYIGMAYHTPAYSDKDYTATQALLQILTNNPSGILYKALVEKKLATAVGSQLLQLKDPGYAYLEAEVPKEKSLDSAKTVFLSVLDKIGSTTITKEELDRAKNAIIKQIENITNNTIGLCVNLTEAIGAGDWRLFYLNRDRIEKLTLADVQAVANKYYKSSNRTWGLFIPDKNPDRVKVADAGDIDALVKNYKGKEVKKQTETFETSIANIKANTQYKKLANGFRYALLRKPAKGEKIIGNFNLPIGNEKSLENKSTIAALTAAIVASLAGKANSIATIFTLDIYKKKLHPEADEKKMVWVGRVTVVIAMIIAIVISPLLGIDNKGGFQYLQEYTGFVSPGIFAMFILGFFWRKTTSTAALFATVGGFMMSIFFKFLPLFADLSFMASSGFSKPNDKGVFEIPFLDRMGFVFVICVIVMIIISLIQNKIGIKPNALEVDKKMFKLSPSFTVGALIIGGLIAALYTIFW